MGLVQEARRGIAGLFRRQGSPLAKDNLNARDNFEEMRRRVEVRIGEVPVEQWPVRTTEALRLLADCLNKDPYTVAPDITSVINHGIIKFSEERRGQRAISLLTPDMFRAFAAYHWTKLWSSNNLQARVGLARQMLGERNPLAALLNNPVYGKRASGDISKGKQQSHRVVSGRPIFVSAPDVEEPALAVPVEPARPEKAVAVPAVPSKGQLDAKVLQAPITVWKEAPQSPTFLVKEGRKPYGRGRKGIPGSLPKPRPASAVGSGVRAGVAPPRQEPIIPAVLGEELTIYPSGEPDDSIFNEKGAGTAKGEPAATAEPEVPAVFIPLGEGQKLKLGDVVRHNVSGQIGTITGEKTMFGSEYVSVVFEGDVRGVTHIPKKVVSSRLQVEKADDKLNED